jgi:hypothetical protein
MSDSNLTMQRQLLALQDGHEHLRKADVPPLYPPFIPERVIPIALALSGNTHGYFAQPWAVNVLAFYVTVNVLTTNNGTNFWTIRLRDSAANIVASVDTSALSAGAAFRLVDTTITQPVAASPFLDVLPIATGSPGSLYLIPAVALLRAGN